MVGKNTNIYKINKKCKKKEGFFVKLQNVCRSKNNFNILENFSFIR